MYVSIYLSIYVCLSIVGHPCTSLAKFGAKSTSVIWVPRKKKSECVRERGRETLDRTVISYNVAVHCLKVTYFPNSLF